jgi:hypothetical protein
MYQSLGINTRPGQNDVEGGVMQIRRRMSHGKLAVADHLEVYKKEARAYRIEDRKDGKFAVVKENDHVMDALRYGCMEEPYEPVEMPEDPKALPDNVARPPTQLGSRSKALERAAGRFA